MTDCEAEWTPQLNMSQHGHHADLHIGEVSGLPHINSIMMKNEEKADATTEYFKPQPVTFHQHEYKPIMHETLADYYSSGLGDEVPTSYAMAQLPYSTSSIIQYYDMPQFQMPFHSGDYETSTSSFLSASQSQMLSSSSAYETSSPTYSPPPQDPLVTKPKKRIPAVPCHSNSICANCKTKETTLWRRNHTGEIECNACNLYFRKNNRKRPLSLRKDGILKRNRKPRCESPNTRPRS